MRHLGNFKLIYTSGAKVRRQPKTDRLRNTDFDLHKFVSKCHTPGFTYSTGTVVSGSIERKVGSTVNTGIRGEEGDGSLGGASPLLRTRAPSAPPPHTPSKMIYKRKHRYEGTQKKLFDGMLYLAIYQYLKCIRCVAMCMMASKVHLHFHCSIRGRKSGRGV